MVSKIICYLLVILSIDLYVLFYKFLKKISLKRIQAAEKRQGYTEEELSTLKDISSKGTIIAYGLSAIIGCFYVNFINSSYISSNSFFDILSIDFQITILGTLMFSSIAIIIKYIKNILGFAKGFKSGLIDYEDEE